MDWGLGMQPRLDHWAVVAVAYVQDEDGFADVHVHVGVHEDVADVGAVAVAVADVGAGVDVGDAAAGVGVADAAVAAAVDEEAVLGIAANWDNSGAAVAECEQQPRHLDDKPLATPWHNRLSTLEVGSHQADLAQ